MTSLKRIYWDACSWIALIQKERILDDKGALIEDRYTMCRSVISAAEKSAIEIVTSTLSLAEVCKSPAVKATEPSKIAEYFEVDYILLVNLDRAVGELARTLMGRGYSKLKPADACHLASAAIANAIELHTFDEKLLALDGLIDKSDKTRLRICRPDAGGSPAPLLEAMKPVLIESVKAAASKPEPRNQATPTVISLPDIDYAENKEKPLQVEGPPNEPPEGNGGR